MSLITIAGYPSSGKTRRAQQIKGYLEERFQDPAHEGPKLKVVILSDDSLSIDRSAYNESRSEKPARGALFTAMQRQMAQDTVLIVDAPNYIKGFRYQMYCAAREQKMKICTVYVVATHDLCREWNTIRQDRKSYAPETLENMLLRFEEPSSMVRWDSPLITMLWDEELPQDQIWKAAMEGIVKPPNAGTQSTAKAPTDALHTLEQTTTALVSAILNEQTASGGLGGAVSLSLSTSVKTTVTLPWRTLTLSELQRLRRQFVTVHKRAITLGTTEKGSVDWSEASVADKFGTYLEENLKP